MIIQLVKERKIGELISLISMLFAEGFREDRLEVVKFQIYDAFKVVGGLLASRVEEKEAVNALNEYGRGIGMFRSIEYLLPNGSKWHRQMPLILIDQVIVSEPIDVKVYKILKDSYNLDFNYPRCYLTRGFVHGYFNRFLGGIHLEEQSHFQRKGDDFYCKYRILRAKQFNKGGVIII